MNTILGMPVVVFGVIAQLVGMAVCTVGIEYVFRGVGKLSRD
jgi:hypothetical protein